jgi:hypothetical protein
MAIDCNENFQAQPESCGRFATVKLIISHFRFAFSLTHAIFRPLRGLCQSPSVVPPRLAEGLVSQRRFPSRRSVKTQSAQPSPELGAFFCL